jgi:hypothetical protein
MNLSTITHNILNNFKTEIEKEENILIIKNDLLKPIIKYTIDEIYPYFIKCIILISSIMLFLVVMIFLNLKVILKYNQ